MGGIKRGRDCGEENIDTSDPLFSNNNGASPILPIQLSFGSESESDKEVIISSQANKKRKMSETDTLKLWISTELDKKLDKLATRSQLDSVMTAVEGNTARLERQEKEIEGMRGTIRTLEMEMNDNRRSFDARVKKMVAKATAGRGQAGPSLQTPWENPQPAQLLGQQTKTQEKMEEEKRMFETARRSLRIWPLRGDTAEEMKLSVEDFC